MENNNYENYEVTEIDEVEVIDMDDYTEEDCESGKGKLLALTIGGLALLATGTVVAVKKIKEKKADKPKKKRRKLMWVEIDEETCEEVAEEVETVEEEVK